MSDQERLPERSNRIRVAVPVSAPRPPVLKPSLIPFDVLQAYEREVLLQQREAEERAARPTTAENEHVEDVSDADIDDSGPMAGEALDARSLEPASVESAANFITEGPADPEVAMLALSQVSVFQGLPRASLEAMARTALQEEVPAGEYLFVEGDAAESFYVVVDGTLEILRKKDDREVALRHLGGGEAIGLFGLFSAQLRAASARAIGDAVVLEVPCAQLQRLLESDDELHNRLLRFYRERILEGFVGSSRVFADVDSIARARIIGKFVQKNLSPGETLMTPGEVGNLLAVVTHGTLVLEERSRVAKEPRQFDVVDGQFVVCTSALSGMPGRMRIYAEDQVSLVMLNHKDLTDLMRDYPALRALPTRLQQHARSLDRDIFCGHTGVPGL